MQSSNPYLNSILDTDTFPFELLKEVKGEQYVFYILKATPETLPFPDVCAVGEVEIYFSVANAKSVMQAKPYDLIHINNPKAAIYDLLRHLDYETLNMVKPLLAKNP